MGVLQTSQEELQAFYAMALPGFLEYIKNHGTSVDKIEMATTLEGIKSLPALMQLGGVEKTVLAPLNLLTKDVDEQIENCKEATTNANLSASEASAAAKRVTDAIVDISTQKQEALNAASSARTAATSANTAATAANVAASKANNEASNLSGLKTACQDVTTRCESAVQGAEEKVVEMDALMKNFSGEGQAAPARMVIQAPTTISTKNKIAQRIGVILYPSYVMRNVLFNRFEGNSLHINPSGNLTVIGLGKSRFYVIPTGNTEIWQQVDITVREPQMRLTSSGKIRLNNGRIRIV